MSYHSILEYINELAKFYFVSQKAKKTEMLNHATEITGLHRKTALLHKHHLVYKPEICERHFP